MTTMNGALDAIVATIGAAFPALKTCEKHPGKFDADEIKRQAVRTPAIFVSCLGVADLSDPGTEQSDATLILAAFILTASVPGLTRDDAARNMAEALLIQVPRARWGLTGAGQAKSVRADNLYSGEIATKGVALWAVVWRQQVRMGTSIWDGTGPVPTQLYLGIAPEIGLAHVDDYVPVEVLP